MARGRVVADGPTTEIKARVGSRIIRCTLPGIDAVELQTLPGVSGADVLGDAVRLTCVDSDAAIRQLVTAYPDARDFEVSGAGLEEAFLALTSDDHNDQAGATR
jgi:ABC-2 type transport system ATP-binding protein